MTPIHANGAGESGLHAWAGYIGGWKRTT